MNDTVTKMTEAHQIDIFEAMLINEREVEIGKIHPESDKRLIYEFFKNHAGQSYTPFEVLRELRFDDFKITSVRRAISDLTDIGVLIDTKKKRKGPLGRNNNLWSIA